MKLVDPKITVLMVVEVDRDSATTRGKDKTENDFGLSSRLLRARGGLRSGSSAMDENPQRYFCFAKLF
jgi:hypothetical protein